MNQDSHGGSMMVQVFLDVDGVVNPWVSPGSTLHLEEFADFTAHDLGVAGVATLSREMGEMMTAALGGAVVRWLTYWDADAPALLSAPLGVPAWPWLAWEPTKAHAVAGCLLEASTPFVWIDDDDAHPGELDVVSKFLATHDRTLPPNLLIHPRTTVGLTRSDLADVSTFVAIHR